MAPRLRELAEVFTQTIHHTAAEPGTHIGPHFLLHWFTRLDRQVSIWLAFNDQCEIWCDFALIYIFFNNLK